METHIAQSRSHTLASSGSSSGQRTAAVAVCVAALVASLVLMPHAAQPMPPMPGFVASNQTALIVVHATTTALFFAQFRRSRSTALLVLAIGSLYTTLIVAAQLLSFPGVFAAGRMLGQGPDTTIWLWTFWHLGPPVFAIGYALTARAGSRVPPGWVATVAGAAAAITVLLTGFVILLAIDAGMLLPRTVVGDDYALLTTTGIGPLVLAVTVAALATLCMTTRLRALLQLWLAVSLFLLTIDNVITMAGAARATIGWTAGRFEALVAGIVLLGVYLRELDVLHARAERMADERERERAALQAARDSLAVALDAAGMGDWEMDLRDGTVRRDPRHDQIFGYPTLQPRWSRADLLSHVVQADRAAVVAAFDRAAQHGTLEVECRIVRGGDGAVRWIALRGRARRDAARLATLMTGVVMDITERRHAEERLHQAQRMEAIGQLTGGVAHDFNNLLTIIVGNLDMISRKPDNVQRVQRLAASGLTAARRGAEVTQKLLAFSRRQVLHPETVNPNGLLQAFRPLLRRAVGDAITVTFDLDPSLHPVRLDPGQFESAILNLAVNARDAMPSGGRLTIRTGNVAMTAEDPSSLPELAPGDYVVVCVTDTGSGIEAKTLPRVFEPFFTTKDVGKGTGLGLSQVYGFSKQAGGHVRVESEPGKGATIVMYLPRSGDPPVDAQRDTRGVPLRRAAEGEVILVVEDEPAVLDMAVESLDELGYATRTATDAAGALRQLRSGERIDILFSDIIMPGGMNGAQLSVEARRLRPDLRVLLTSGYTGLTEETLPADVPLLTKPYLREDLADKLRVVLGRA